MMHEFSTVDGFVEISECMADMIKYVANEPSVGLYFIQQHAQNAVPNVIKADKNIVEKVHETTLHTEDLEDSITAVRSMKECGFSIVDEMIGDINKSLEIMKTKRGLIHSSTSTPKSQSERTSFWGNHAFHAQESGDKKSSYFSNVLNHTLLKPQQYQQPSYIHTRSSPFASCPPFYQQQPYGISNPPSTFTSSLTPPILTHINPPNHNNNLQSILQQLKHSQQICLQTMSNCMDAFSALNADLTSYNNFPTIPSSFTPQDLTYNNIHPTQQNTSVLQNSFNNHQPPLNNSTYTVIPAIFTPPPPPLKISTHPSKPQDPLHHTNHPSSHTELELVVDGNTFYPSADSNSHVTMEEKKLVNNDIVTEPTHLDNVVGDSIFTVSENDEKLEICEEVTEDNFTPAAISHAVEEENKFAPDLIANFNPVSDSVKQQKRRVFDVTAPLPQHLFIFDSGDDKRRVRSLAIFGNGICVFDPGGNERNCGSPALNSINNHGIQSPLQAPWDRGKLGVSKSLSSVKHVFLNCLFSFTPAVVSFPARGATSGWPWVPWSSSLYDDHRLMSSPWKSCDNAILLSLLWLPWDRGRKDLGLGDEFGLTNVCSGPAHTLDYLHFIMGSSEAKKN